MWLAGTYVLGAAERVQHACSWVLQLLRQRLREGEMFLPPPVTANSYRLLSEGLLHFETVPPGQHVAPLQLPLLALCGTYGHTGFCTFAQMQHSSIQVQNIRDTHAYYLPTTCNCVAGNWWRCPFHSHVRPLLFSAPHSGPLCDDITKPSTCTALIMRILANKPRGRGM